MAERYEAPGHEENPGLVLDALARGDAAAMRAVLGSMHPADIALLLPSLPVAERDALREGLDDAVRAEVFAEADDAVRTPRSPRSRARSIAPFSARRALLSSEPVPGPASSRAGRRLGRPVAYAGPGPDARVEPRTRACRRSAPGYQRTRIQCAISRSWSPETPLRRSRRPSPSVSMRK